MTKFGKGLLVLGVVVLVIYGIYRVFLKPNKVIAHFDQNFTLENKMDQASLDGEVIFKYMGLDDNRCLDDDCEREGEKVAKLLVVNNHRITYVKLGTLVDTQVDLEKFGYQIQLINISEDNEIELKVTKLE